MTQCPLKQPLYANLFDMKVFLDCYIIKGKSKDIKAYISAYRRAYRMIYDISICEVLNILESENVLQESAVEFQVEIERNNDLNEHKKCITEQIR